MAYRHRASGIGQRGMARGKRGGRVPRLWPAAGPRWLLVGLVLLAGSLLAAVPAASAQGVIELLQRQRLEARVAEVAAELGPVVAVLPPLALGEPDPFSAGFAAVEARRKAARDSVEAARVAEIRRDSLAGTPRRLVWDKVEPGAQGGFLERYREVFWKAANPQNATADTMGTPRVRARLQSIFGRPTRNADAVRQIGYTGNEFVQFEYWFVVNDSIPVLLLDLDGPFGRGLLMAGSEEFAAAMPGLKDDLSRQIVGAPGPDPFVDYYHSFERQQWFRTGYNGTDFFTLPIRPPGWSRREAVDRWIIHR